MLRRAAEVKPGAALDIEFADGHVGAHADARERKPEAEAKLRAGAATTSRARCSEAEGERAFAKIVLEKARAGWRCAPA